MDQLMPIAIVGSTVKPCQPKLGVGVRVSEVEGSLQPITNRDGQITEVLISLTGYGLSWMLPKVSLLLRIPDHLAGSNLCMHLQGTCSSSSPTRGLLDRIFTLAARLWVWAVCFSSA